MRILIATSSPADRGSGINAAVNELCWAMQALGCEIHYLSPPPHDPSWPDEKGITHIATDQYSDSGEAVRRILEHVKEHEIDVAINNDNPHLQSAAPALPCPVLSVGHMGRTSVATLACHQHEWTDHVIAISSDMQLTFGRKFGIPVSKCPIVMNGVGAPRERTVPRREDHVLRVVFAGGWSRNKGSAFVRRALEHDPSAWKGVELHWFGDVPDRVARSMARHPSVELHGRVPRDEFLNVLGEADAFLLPSRTEGCPMALIEAMSLGVIPISSDGLGAMRWMVTSGIDGFVCGLDAFDKHLVECLRFLRRNVETRNVMKSAAREKFARDLRSDATATAILDLARRPTVDRTARPDRIELLRWHRPVPPGGGKSPIIDRICIRLGILRRAGSLDVSPFTRESVLDTPTQASARD